MLLRPRLILSRSARVLGTNFSAEIAHNLARIEDLFQVPMLKSAKSRLDLRLVVQNGIQQ
jgi:hypothetical protein